MMTDKLYYKDAYLSEHSAKVVGCESTDGGYAVELDQTAFFPNEGGQESDGGIIGSVRVLRVYETDGRIIHLTDAPLPVGSTVECRIDFAQRYEKMKCHTAEHILCGIIHRRFGFDNVGFHLSSGEAVFDIGGVLDRSAIDLVEDEANRAVAANIPVRAYFPTAQELATLEYRSKLELSDGVRIVDIPGVDSCACCAPHVAATGEIGVIKLIAFEKHRGGTRIRMVAGLCALADYRARLDAVARISELLCAPQSDVAAAVEALLGENEALRASIKETALAVAREAADAIAETDGNSVYHFPRFGVEELREIARLTSDRVGGILVLLGGVDGELKYVMTSSSTDLRAMSRTINSALCGRGGGRPEIIQGSFAVGACTVREYFAGASTAENI